MTNREIDNILKHIFEKNILFIIAGPCVIENMDVLKRSADKISKISQRTSVPCIFKSSYSKANRSSIDSYTGPGLVEGLKMLETIKNEFSLPVLTDIHLPSEASAVSEVADILQIPAFLSRQTDIIVSAAKTGKIINIKKGQFASSNEISLAAEKASASGNKNIILTERGTTFGYNDLIVDFRNFFEMEKTGYPVVYDVTHSLQRPAAKGKISGGSPEYAAKMANAAIATGSVKGLFIETHPEPEKALSDRYSMVDLETFEKIVSNVINVKNAGKR